MDFVVKLIKSYFASKLLKHPLMYAFPVEYRSHNSEQVVTTNMHAMELIYAGLAGNGAVFFTNYQLKGKGQRGKSWISEPGESILMSLVLDTNRLTPSQGFRL